MLTSLPDAGARPDVVKDDRPAYRPFAVQVADIRQLSPHFLRLTFTGPDAHWFGTDRQDQRIKVLIPDEDGNVSEVGADDPEAILAGTWYETWRALPEDGRSPFRTYTVRDVRPEQGEFDVDMVAHGDAGPASRWLGRVQVGDRLVIVGPDSRSKDSAVGADWAPGTASELLLAGDETAAPAICSILETLPAGRNARAFIEVPTQADALAVDLPEGARITWLAREQHDHGHLLVPAVSAWVQANAAVVDDALAVVPQAMDDVDVDSELLWDSPVLQVQAIDACGRGERCGSDFYAWFAGEASVIKSLRRILVSDVGVCRRRVAFMGYWRQGRAEGQ
ncbi:siderophore-interacting protein [Occultella kanbiaonis]|uniref:siderophore-interacting protein n=1 Tax=Occultella kanbiaonis TaxID=2675754 RepID=UPI0012B6B809|nr:siderophore-interacting protein [Occultella kanbiaonis]